MKMLLLLTHRNKIQQSQTLLGYFDARRQILKERITVVRIEGSKVEQDKTSIIC